MVIPPDFDLPVPDQMLRDSIRDKINALHKSRARHASPGRGYGYYVTERRTLSVTFVLEEERKNSKVKKRTLEPFWKGIST